MIRTLALALAAATVALGAPPAAAITGSEIVAKLNALRAQHGFPAGLVEDPAMSAGCALHNEYMRLNNVVGHSEDPALPGYTEAGHRAAATSVLAWGGSTWNGRPHPWENAPLHLAQMFSPRLVTTGAAESEAGFNCLTTVNGMIFEGPAPAADTMYSYPGNGQTIAYAQNAREDPFVPSELVGIPQGTLTGPNLMVFWDGPSFAPWEGRPSVPSSAALTGPGGPVEIRVIDSQLIGGYIVSGGAFILPVATLAPRSQYTASVSWGTNPPQTYTFSFTTSDQALDSWGNPGTGAHASIDFTNYPYAHTGGVEGPARARRPFQSVTLPRRISWRKAVRSGIRVKVHRVAASAPRLTARLMHRRKEVGAARARARRPGNLTLTVNLAKRFKPRRSVRLVVRVSAGKFSRRVPITLTR